MEKMNCWVEPLDQGLIRFSSLVECVCLLLKYVKDSIRGVAVVEVCGEGMVPEVSTSLFLIFFGGSVEYGLESGNGNSFFAGRGHGINRRVMGSSWSVALRNWVHCLTGKHCGWIDRRSECRIPTDGSKTWSQTASPSPLARNPVSLRLYKVLGTTFEDEPTSEALNALSDLYSPAASSTVVLSAKKRCHSLRLGRRG